MSESIVAAALMRLATRLPSAWAVVDLQQREGLLCASIEGMGIVEVRCGCGDPNCPAPAVRLQQPVVLPVTGADAEALCVDAHLKLVSYAVPEGRG